MQKYLFVRILKIIMWIRLAFNFIEVQFVG